MATNNQIDANRRNAQKSTGPKTAAGKAASRRNATTHGLFAQDVVAAGEDPNLLDALLEALIEEHQPETVTEELLVQRIALAFWRERRLARTERKMMEGLRKVQGLKNAGDPPLQLYQPNQTLVGNELAGEGMLTIQDQLLIGRYQTMISNQLRQAIRELREEKGWRDRTIDALPQAQIANDAEDDPEA